MGQRSFRMIETNGITLRVVVEGQGPLLLLLHGFPQCWYLWRHQIDELLAAGYQVAVPDQRGYGGSDKPADVEAYDARELVADAVGIADALGRETFTLVTHDFGAVLGWDIALLHPERVTAVFALSVPPCVDASQRCGTRPGMPRSARLAVSWSATTTRHSPLLADAFANVDQNVTDLRGNIVLDGAGHWLPLERTEEINSALLAFLHEPRYLEERAFVMNYVVLQCNSHWLTDDSRRYVRRPQGSLRARFMDNRDYP